MRYLIHFFSEHQDKIVLIIGAILIASIGFAAGRLTSQRITPQPVEIKESNSQLIKKVTDFSRENGQVKGQESVEQKISSNDLNQSEKREGNFVGNKKSKKFHYPDCKYAKKMKKENQIWFSSIEEAEKAGYQPCKVCKPE